MKIIKRIILFIIIIISQSLINAQRLTNPEPTTASLQNYINVVESPATGISPIHIPLFDLETNNKNVPVSLALSYHPNNATSEFPASEVGLGWSLFKVAGISKESFGLNNEFIEINDLNKANADCYYYFIPGHNGKFKIYKDIVSNELKLFNLSGENIKIEFFRDLNSSKLIINSFTITDDKGTKYNFQDFDLGQLIEYPGQTSKNTRTSHLITSIYDANNNNLANFSYDIKTKTNSGATSLKYKKNKLKTISTRYGKLKFDYIYNAIADENNDYTQDVFKVDYVSLATNSEAIISKFKFVFNGKNLVALKKIDSALNETEIFNFSYNNTGSDTQYGPSVQGQVFGYEICNSNIRFENPQTFSKNLLSYIKYPTGGSIQYDYEANEIFKDRSNENYEAESTYTEPLIQYYDITDEIPFNTNITRNYTFTVNRNSPVKIELGIDDDVDYSSSNNGHSIAFNFSLYDSSNTKVETYNSTSSCLNNFSQKFYKLGVGTYTIKINSWGGTGKFFITQLKSLPKPYKNFQPVNSGARIKKITYYDSNDIFLKQKTYEYNSFSDPNSSSGYTYASEEGNANENGSYVLYKNIRVTEISGTLNNGHIDYFYKVPDDYYSSSSNNTWQNFNIVSQGILSEKRLYNSQNQLIESTVIDYEFSDIPNLDIQLFSNYQYIPSYIKNVKNTYIEKRNSADFKVIKENFYSPNNFQEILAKTTTSDGEISEIITKYASDIGNTRFLNKNIISIPLQIESKSNGNVMSKTTTYYNNSNNFYPTSIESTDLNQISETDITFDLYDDKGNLFQSTDKAGNSVTTIWGYYQTLPIAVIVGAKYSDISSLLVITEAINKSNEDADNPSKEVDLIIALENLRLNSQLQEYSVTTSTYDPLIGVTNSINANGIRQNFEYDTQGRLYKVKNALGQVIKENHYNYKH